MKIVTLEIEEFEQGAWVADIVSIDQFTGSFTFQNTTWNGTKVSEIYEDERYHTRIVGGGGGLGKVLEDKYYSGNVSLQSALSEVCRLSGETMGTTRAATFLSTFERLRGPATTALDSLAQAFGMIWWIGRDGMLNMNTERPAGAKATGSRVSSDVDSILLVEAVASIGGTYGDDNKTIRHIRWNMDEKRMSATIYFLPFIFRPPVDKRYASLDSASVDRNNGDGTIDVIVGGRYGMTKVPLLVGVPGSKAEVRGGEQVSVGYFGGDPQKPFAICFSQNTNATKEVARKTDSIKAIIPAGTVIVSVSGGGGSPAVGTPNLTDIELTGEITNGSVRLKVGD